MKQVKTELNKTNYSLLEFLILSLIVEAKIITSLDMVLYVCKGNI